MQTFGRLQRLSKGEKLGAEVSAASAVVRQGRRRRARALRAGATPRACMPASTTRATAVVASAPAHATTEPLTLWASQASDGATVTQRPAYGTVMHTIPVLSCREKGRALYL